MASLFILKGDNSGQDIPLDKDVVIIGRSLDCDLVLPSASVSRQHARLLRAQGRWFIEDMQSRNGTFVNNQRITTRTPLTHTDRIRICDFLAAFHETPPSTLPPELVGVLTGENDSTSHDTGPDGHSKKVLAVQSSENLKVILEISNYLVKALELDQLLPRIADSLFQLFKQAERCFLILDEGPGRLVARAVRTRSPQVAGTAIFSHRIVQHCLKTAQPFLTDDAGADSRLASSISVAELQLRSVMCAPLITPEGKAVGVIQLDTRERQKFSQDDLNLLEGVANQAAVALENARMHEDLLQREQLERDLEVAAQMQRSMLPEQLPEVDGYEFFAHYAAALTVGGDYYDFIPLPRQRLAVTLADVAGKGVTAALLMAKLSSEMRTCLLAEAEPIEAVARLNDVLYPHTQRTHRFVTLVAAVLDPGRQVVTLVNAGHLPPLLYRRASGTLAEAAPRAVAGTVLGLERGLKYQSCQVALDPGDCLLLFTDGVCEAVNARNRRLSDSLDGIYALLREGGPYRPLTLGERLVKAAEQHAIRRSQSDDITLVCFGRKV